MRGPFDWAFVGHSQFAFYYSAARDTKVFLLYTIGFIQTDQSKGLEGYVWISMGFKVQSLGLRSRASRCRV